MKKDQKFVITINRELGSGGRTIGKIVAERLGVKFYDKAWVKALEEKYDLSLPELEKLKAKKHNWWNDFADSYMKRYSVETRIDMNETVPTSENIYNIESKVLKDVAAEESCVIAGRSAFHIFKDTPNTLKILIQSTMEKRVERVMERQNLSESEARKLIEKLDKGRETYTQKFSGTSRYDTRNYDMVLNVAGLTEDEAASIILDYINKTK